MTTADSDDAIRAAGPATIQAVDWLESVLADCGPSIEMLTPDRRAFVLGERKKCVEMHLLMVEAQREVNRRRLP